MTDHPLRLSIGTHKAGTGQGCAMNVISWENGDTTITDFPGCADRLLARVVQRVNDGICTHRTGDLLCAACSVDVLTLAHRTVGTAAVPVDAERRRVWVQIANAEAQSVAHLNTDPRVGAAIDAAQVWVDDPTAYAAYAAAAAAAWAAAGAAAGAAYAAALMRAHALIDLFEELTGHTPVIVTAEATTHAVEQMLAVK